MEQKPTKAQIIALLRAFTAQRSGIEYRNYCSDWRDTEGRRAYFSEARSIQRDGREARALLAFVEACDGITGPMLETALRGAFSGRLSLRADVPRVVLNDDAGPVQSGPIRWALDYCTGQYFATEYRRAVCAVLASAIWAHFRTGMPTPFKVYGTDSDWHAYRAPNARVGDGSVVPVSAGEWLRRTARDTFGRGIASRWFH